MDDAVNDVVTVCQLRQLDGLVEGLGSGLLGVDVLACLDGGAQSSVAT